MCVCVCEGVSEPAALLYCAVKRRIESLGHIPVLPPWARDIQHSTACLSGQVHSRTHSSEHKHTVDMHTYTHTRVHVHQDQRHIAATHSSLCSAQKFSNNICLISHYKLKTVVVLYLTISAFKTGQKKNHFVRRFFKCIYIYFDCLFVLYFNGSLSNLIKKALYKMYNIIFSIINIVSIICFIIIIIIINKKWK